MSDTAIRAERLGKHNRIGQRRRYKALRGTLTNGFQWPIHAIRAALQPANSSRSNPSMDAGQIWALKNLSLNTSHGEVVGIVGRNRAGKSTLPKILSRITECTEGTVGIYGRVGSLLEVGTGFNPELTGRKHIYLNGAILGMNNKQMDRKFDEIVAFAEIERFLDSPVKHFSTGMQTRLGFAVAAHLEPELLVVDEVLAVGDLAFQKKCLAKSEASKAERTIPIVSHQLNQIRRLCERTVWLEHGHIRAIRRTEELVGAYERAFAAASDGGPAALHTSVDLHTSFVKWELVDLNGKGSHFWDIMGPVTVKFVLDATKPIRKDHHGIHLYNSDGLLLWGTGFDGLEVPAGRSDLLYQFEHLHLRPGTYSWLATVYDEDARYLSDGTRHLLSTSSLCPSAICGMSGPVSSIFPISSIRFLTHEEALPRLSNLGAPESTFNLPPRKRGREHIPATCAVTARLRR